MSEKKERDLTKSQKLEITTIVKEVGGEGSRVLEFIASTETPDRSNDIIDVAGWDLTNYNKNAIFAWSHDYSKLPVGKGVNAFADIRNKALKIQVKFPTIAELCSDVEHPSKEALLADTVYNMYKGGYLNAVSVGFRGLEYEQRSDDSVKDLPMWERGIHFKKAELFELSAVLVPCNQEALVTMRGMKSFNPEGLKMVEDILSKSNVPEGETSGEVEDMEITEQIKALTDKVTSLEEKLNSNVETKAGAKFSAATKAELQKVSEAMKACHKGMKACHESLSKMLEDPQEDPAGDEGTDAGSDSGVEKPKPNDKALDLASDGVESIAHKLFSEDK
jgi:hypothetical protein